MLLITILPTSLMAQNGPSAILQVSGKVLLNGADAASSSAIFTGDQVETGNGSSARIEVTGSTIDVSPGTMVQFEGDDIFLGHGTVFVTTARGFRVRTHCVEITPVEQDWTQYAVAEADDNVTVAAKKRDVNFNAQRSVQKATRTSESQSVSVREGEEKSRKIKCGAAPASPGALGGARLGILNSPWAKYSGMGAIALMCGLLICRDGDDPVSPWRP